MQANDGVGLFGQVLIELVNEETGEVEGRHQYNALTPAFKNAVASLIASSGIAAPSHIALGLGDISVNYAASYRDADKVFKNTGIDQRFAMFLYSSTNETVQHVAFWMKRVGSSLGLLYVDIYTQTASQPGTLVATSAAVNADGLSISHDWVTFTFAPGVAITGATNYWFVLRAVGHTYINSVAEIIVGIDTAYVANNMSTYNGTTWSSISPNARACARVVLVHDSADTALFTESLRKSLTSSSAVGSQARLLTNFTTTENNDFIGEVGLFNAASGPSLHAVISTAFIKSSQQSLNVYWLLSISG